MSDKKIDNLQQIINKRAKDKLDADILEISKFLRSKSSLLEHKVSFNLGVKEEPKNTTIELYNILYWGGKAQLKHKIIEKHLPKYIEEETKLFLEELEGSLGYMQDLQEQLSQYQ